MVVRLVLEHEEPVLVLAVHIDRNADAARIDLLGRIEVIELPLSPQRLHPDDSDIHQCHITLLAVRIQHPAIVHIGSIGLKDRHGEESVLDVHGIDRRGKGCVAAVIRPIGINDPQLRDRRSTVLRIAEILLDEGEILLAHGKAAFFMKFFQRSVRELVELCENLHVRRQYNSALKRRRGLK